MKNLEDYMIWLKSGKTICGTVEGEALEYLKKVNLLGDKNDSLCDFGPCTIEFRDTEGLVRVRRQAIEAITFTPTSTVRGIGYREEG